MDNKMEEDQVEQQHLQKWTKSSDYVMSLIALALGLGNLWRFPFVAYKNGGGAFLIPYLLTLAFVSRPLYFLEMCLGQFATKGSVKMFSNMAPCLKGLGYMQAVGTLTVSTYYSSLMALCLIYFVYSFNFDLPWSNCRKEWEPRLTEEIGNVTCMESTEVGPLNLTGTVSSAEMFLKFEVLNEKENIEDGIGDLQWKMVVAVLISWIVICLVCVRDVKSSGRVAHFLTIFPLFCLLLLLIRALSLPGSFDGVKYYLTPQWDKLLKAKVWYYAITQCFFSLNIGQGVVTTYSSHNVFRSNIVRVSWIVGIADTCTSFFSGIIVFAVLGNLSYKMQVNIRQVLHSSEGISLAFVSYPEALARIDHGSWLLAIIFFIVLFFLGVGCNISQQSQGQNILCETFPKAKLWIIAIFVATILFSCSLPYTAAGGQQVLTVVDYFGGNFIFIFINIFELIAISYYYGLTNICDDFEFMLGKRLGMFWRVSWSISVPLILTSILVYFLVTYEEITYRNRPFPTYLLIGGYSLLGFGLSQPIIWTTYEFLKNAIMKKQGCGDLWRNFVSHQNWRPFRDDDYNEWLQFKQNKNEERNAKNRNWFMRKIYALIGD